MAGPLRMQSDVRPNKRPQQQFDASPLIDRSLTIRNRYGEERSLSGKVPLGISALDEIRIILSQNGGTCEAKQGTGDLSELMWITHISLSDGFTVKDWLQIRNRDNEFGRSKVVGSENRFWDNAETIRVKSTGTTTITEDYGETRELPNLGDGLKGCGGSMTQGELKAVIAAKYGALTETVWVNPDTGQIKKDGELPKDDFRLITLPAPNDPVVSYALKADTGLSHITTGTIFQMVLHSQAFEEGYRNQTFVLVPTIPPFEQPARTSSISAQAKTVHLKAEDTPPTSLLLNPTEREVLSRSHGLPDDEISHMVLQRFVLQHTQLMQMIQHTKPNQQNYQDATKPIQQPVQVMSPTLAFSAFNAQPDVRPGIPGSDAVIQRQKPSIRLPAQTSKPTQTSKIQETKTGEPVQKPKARRKRIREQQEPHNQTRTRSYGKTTKQLRSLEQTKKPKTRRISKQIDNAKLADAAKKRAKNKKRSDILDMDGSTRHGNRVRTKKPHARTKTCELGVSTTVPRAFDCQIKPRNATQNTKTKNNISPRALERPSHLPSGSCFSVPKTKRRGKNEFRRYFLLETLGLYDLRRNRKRRTRITGRISAGSLR